MPPSKISVFFLRVLSSLALWTLTLATVLKGWETGFFLVLTTIGLVALWEYFHMLEKSGRHTFRIFGMVCGIVLLTGGFYFSREDGPTRSYDFEILVLLAFILGVFTRQIFEKTHDPAPLHTMAFTIFGLFYVAWLFSFVTKIVYIVPRNADGSVAGQFYVLYLIAVTKFSDMGAYIVGSLIGKHLLIPHISPAKTWEGFFGALAFSLLASFGFWWLLPNHLGALHAKDCWVLGPTLGFAAIVGDLAESLIKRSTGVKDSGKFLPGIGGSLDLVDSLLFTAPLMYFYMHFVVLPNS